MLSDEKLRELLIKAQAKGVKSENEAKEAAQIILEGNLNLVRSVVHRFANRGYEWDDLFQIGCIGLLKSIKRFDLNMNVKFSTYAVPLIIGEIKRFIRDDNPVKISRAVKTLAFKVYKVQEALYNKMGREPTINEISNELSVCAEEVAAALEAVQPQVSLYESAFSNNKGNLNNESYVLDQIKSQETQAVDSIDKLVLKEALTKLPPKEKSVIFLRFFADKTQTETAKSLKISQVQVSRLERQALKLIRCYLLEIR